MKVAFRCAIKACLVFPFFVSFVGCPLSTQGNGRHVVNLSEHNTRNGEIDFNKFPEAGLSSG